MKSKKILAGFGAFLVGMWICTLISKSIYAAKLPIVQVVSVRQKYIEHEIEAEGIVEAGNKNPVTALPGLRVEKLLVGEGDRVMAGDALFTVDLEDLQKIIDNKQAEIDRLCLLIHTEWQTRAWEEEKRALEEQRAREDYDALARYQDTLVGRAVEEVVKAEEEPDGEGSAEDKERLAALQAAAYGEADTRWNRDRVMEEAERKVEDSLFQKAPDATLESYEMQLAGMKKELGIYQEIRDREGIFRAEKEGRVTDLYIQEGSRIPDTAVLLLADESVPCRFKAVLTREQKKYLNLYDKVDIRLEGGRELEAEVTYLTESELAPGSYNVVVQLPEGAGMPGLSGTLTSKKTGDKFPFCVEPEALHKSESRCYVYVVREREGILGEEYYAEEAAVKVRDSNEAYAAIEGQIDQDSRIIISATKEFRNGDTVRLY